MGIAIKPTRSTESKKKMNARKVPVVASLKEQSAVCNGYPMESCILPHSPSKTSPERKAVSAPVDGCVRYNHLLLHHPPPPITTSTLPAGLDLSFVNEMDTNIDFSYSYNSTGLVKYIFPSSNNILVVSLLKALQKANWEKQILPNARH
ncbi:hypothetical protein J6590_053870 [Homalodisca vitripennis]|nr:hypothetical protein J6590_053870 [Homalodisca vitripennis]